MVEDAIIEKIYTEIAKQYDTRPEVVRKIINTMCRSIKTQMAVGIKNKLETYKAIRIAYLGNIVPKPRMISYYRLKNVRYEKRRKTREICDSIALAKGPSYYKTYVEQKAKTIRRERIQKSKNKYKMY